MSAYASNYVVLLGLEVEAAIGIEPMNKGFAEIFSCRSRKNTQGQVGTPTTL